MQLVNRWSGMWGMCSPNFQGRALTEAKRKTKKKKEKNPLCIILRMAEKNKKFEIKGLRIILPLFNCMPLEYKFPL